MSDIEWTDETWNPLRGCRRVSPGCEHCYAERQAARPILSGPGLPYEGLVQIGKQGPHWTGATAGPDKLDVPLRWRKGRRIFPCSMSDLFYGGHADDEIDKVLTVMLLSPQHTYQVLTKRPVRMLRYLSDRTLYRRVLRLADHVFREERPELGRIAISDPSTFPCGTTGERRSAARAAKLSRLARKPQCWCGRVAVGGSQIWDADKGAPMLRCRAHVPRWPGAAGRR